MGDRLEGLGEVYLPPSPTWMRCLSIAGLYVTAQHSEVLIYTTGWRDTLRVKCLILYRYNWENLVLLITLLNEIVIWHPVKLVKIAD